MWTTKPRKYKNDDVKTLNQATVSSVSRALNKYALARVCLITNKYGRHTEGCCYFNYAFFKHYFMHSVVNIVLFISSLSCGNSLPIFSAFSLDGYCARNKSKLSAYVVWQVSQSTFSIVRAVLYSRTTFRSNSTSSSDQIKLSLFVFL